MHKPQRNALTDSDQEYRAIEATLLESARGRWFLAEHGRRARRLDNALLDETIQRLKSSLRGPMALIDQLGGELDGVRRRIAEIRATLSARPISRPSTPGEAPPPPTHAQAILHAAENIHELAWTLQGREGRDFDQRTCEEIARQVIAINAFSRVQANETEVTLDLLARLTAAEDQLARIVDILANESAHDASEG